MLDCPRMIRTGMIGNEIQYESKISRMQTISQADQSLLLSKVFMESVRSDRERRAAHICGSKVRKLFAIRLLPLRVLEGDLSPFFARLPNSQEPHEIESSF